jgi:eukaryotic-like serine/threonine-protein kinase
MKVKPQLLGPFETRTRDTKLATVHDRAAHGLQQSIAGPFRPVASFSSRGCEGRPIGWIIVQMDSSRADAEQATGERRGHLHQSHHPPPGEGDQLGRYKLLSGLGSGGMGVVFRAHDTQLDREVALKLLKPTSGADDAQLRLRREAQAMAQLAHPNVVQVFEVDAVVHGSRVLSFVAMELVEGTTLRTWLKEGSPRIEEVLAAFVQAGRGLAAAHAVGIVHRDFKPDNVLIERLTDGGIRVRVMDFGLASFGPESSCKDVSAELVSSSSGRVSGSSWPAGRFTETGLVMGTPAYMAPEQHAGEEVDARSDQFSFCSTLYEALLGVRPYTGASLEEIAQSKCAGVLAVPQGGKRLSRRLTEVLVRGLAPDRDERWPDMPTLLHALERARAPRGVQRTLAAAIVCLVPGIVWGLSREDPASCDDGLEQIEQVWNDGQANRVRAAFMATEVGYASDASDHVEAAVGSWIGQWREAKATVCAALLETVGSSADLDRRMLCLNKARLGLEALVDVLVQADARTVERSAEAVGALVPAVQCADATATMALEPVPGDAVRAAEVEACRDTLRRIAAMEAAGGAVEALDTAEQTLQEARAIAYPPLVAEAAAQLGSLHLRVGAYEEAVTVLQEAQWTATAARYDEVAASAASNLVFALGYGLSRPDDGLVWARHAAAAVGRLPSSRHEAHLESSLSSLYYRRGDPSKALGHAERSAELEEQLRGADHPEVAVAWTNLGNLLASVGRFDEAVVPLERARGLSVALRGERHPSVANALVGLATIAQLQQRNDDAYALYTEALAIRTDALGERHPLLASLLNNLGSLAHARGDLDEARAHFERVLMIRAHIDPDHPDAALPHNNLGELLRELGEYEAAYEHHERALSLSVAAHGETHPDVAYALHGLGETRLAQGRPADAVQPLERALELRQQLDARRDELAVSAFALARALWADPPMRTRARELATVARDAYTDAGEGFETRRGDVDAWLTDHLR